MDDPLDDSETVSIAAAEQRLREYRPRRVWWRRWARRAGVTAILRQNGSPLQPEVLLIKRTERDGDPWSGHMSFPGGRMDFEDRNIYKTAVRELREETGLNIEQGGEFIGRLSDVKTRSWRWAQRPLIVSPFVFQMTADPQWRLDPVEVAEIVWVPLRFLIDERNREKMTWSRGKVSVTLPCYRYKGYQIWGLTLRMLDEMVDVIRTPG